MAAKKQTKPKTKKRQQQQKQRRKSRQSKPPAAKSQNHNDQFDDHHQRSSANEMQIYDLERRPKHQTSSSSSPANRQQWKAAAAQPRRKHSPSKWILEDILAAYRRQYMEHESFLHRSPSPVYQVMNNYMARFEKIRLDNMRRQEEEEAAAAAAAAAAAQAEEDERNIDLSKIKVHLPHLCKHGVYYYDLTERERKKLTPRTLVNDVLDCLPPQKLNIIVPIEYEIRELFHLRGRKRGKGFPTHSSDEQLDVQGEKGPPPPSPDDAKVEITEPKPAKGGKSVKGKVGKGGGAKQVANGGTGNLTNKIKKTENDDIMEKLIMNFLEVDEIFFKRKSVFKLGPEFRAFKKRKANKKRKREARCRPTIEIDEMSQLVAINFGNEISVTQCLPDSTTN